MITVKKRVSEMTDEEVMAAAKEHVAHAVSWLEILSERYPEKSYPRLSITERIRRISREIEFPEVKLP